MDYHSALRYLYSLVDYEKKRIERYSPDEFKLDRVEFLLEKLGHPHRAYPTLHIAGTKGKGSVSAMLAAIARAGGLKVGLYTSPHLHTYRERIQINGDPMPRRDLAALVEEMRPVVESIPGLTVFEVTTALGFLYFARQQVDVGVIEVGLGGRLDATNVVNPEVSIITSLSLDHTYILGDTIEQIAFEKGGIIKPGVPVVSAPQQAGALEVLQRLSDERGASLTVVGRDWRWETGCRSREGQTFSITAPESDADLSGEYWLPLLGHFQQENATVAIAAAAQWRARGQTWITRNVIRSGLAQTVWPGRMEILSRDPLLVVDCAHNPYSAQVLAEALRQWFPQTRWLLIFGASMDKDIAGMLRALLPLAEHVIVTRSYHPRATAPYTLADLCAELGKGAEIAVDMERALAQAQARLQPGWGILVTGSIFAVADARDAWAKDHPLPLPQGDWVDQPWDAQHPQGL